MAQGGNISVPVHVADTLLDAVLQGYQRSGSNALLPQIGGAPKSETAVPVDTSALLPAVGGGKAPVAPGASVLPPVQTSALDRQISRMTEQVARDEAPPGPHWGQPGSAHPGKMGEFMHVLGRIGDVAGSALAPGVMMSIPGATLNKDIRNLADFRRLQGLEQTRGQEVEQQRQAAETTNIQAQTAQRLMPPEEKPIATAEGFGTFSHGQFTPAMDMAGHAVMPPTKETEPKLIPLSGPGGKPMYGIQHGDKLFDLQGNQLTSTQPYEKSPNMQAKTLQLPSGQQVAGKTDAQGNLLLEDNTPAPKGTKLFQQPTYAAMMPMITGGRATDAATGKWQQEAGAYQGALNTLALAKTGSELSASLVPIGLALMTPTAAGVHRINSAEIAQAGPAIGSLGRRLDAALEKAGNGALAPDTIREAEQFVRMYQKLKYQQYVAQVKQAADTFRMSPDQTFVTSQDGQDEMPLSEALKQSKTAAGAGTPPRGAKIIRWEDIK